MSSVVSAGPTRLLVDTPTAAKMLGLSARTVWSLNAAGELSAIRIGRSVRYSIRELERFIAQREGGKR
jgi:excisionase family DNA binding protein